MLPDRLERVLVLASLTICAMENAGLERADARQFLVSLLHLPRRDEALAAGAAELQHQRDALGRRRRLRPVPRAFGEIADPACRELLLGRDAERAFQRHADLIEIVMMVRVLMPAAIAAEGQAEIFGSAFLAGEQQLGREPAAAMLFLAALELHPPAMNELHRAAP